MKNTNKGFIGLLALLVTLVLIMYWVWKIIPSPSTSSNTSPTNTSTEVSNPLKIEVIDKAKNAKDLIEKGWGNTF